MRPKETAVMKALYARLIFCVTLLFGSLAGSGNSPAQTPQLTAPGPSARTIRLSMIAVDAANHSMDDETQKEVEFLEDCLPQTITSVSRDQRPVDYALVMDNSLSFRDLLVPALEG